jgi:hypothetical protein
MIILFKVKILIFNPFNPKNYKYKMRVLIKIKIKILIKVI